MLAPAQPLEAETLPPSLTPQESDRLRDCEETIEHGLQTFYEVGCALAEIRDSRLYRATYGSFENYCQERWGISRRRGDELIAAAAVVNNVRDAVPASLESERNSAHVIPTNEAQANEIAHLDPTTQRIAWEIVVDAAERTADGKPMITAAHVKSAVSHLTEAYKAAGIDSDFGEVKVPLGELITLDIKQEALDSLIQEKECGRQEGRNGDDECKRKSRAKSDRSEVEALYDPEIQSRLTRYVEMISGFEAMDWPPEVDYLRGMFHLHKTHAHFQKTRSLERDCEEALAVLHRLSPDWKLGFEVAAQQHYDWLFDLGYCMSKREYTSRMKYMSEDQQRMALWTDQGDNARQDGRRGALPGIIVLPWSKIRKLPNLCDECGEAFEPSGKEKICGDCKEEAAG